MKKQAQVACFFVGTNKEVGEDVRDTAFRNLAEPWMAEQSVQGSIHSVFLKAVSRTSSSTKVPFKDD
ncbi:MAG: hypothetical protein ABJM19_04410 [Marinobacter sp.]|uniref:hypothetical protein n=1 Tax=Marinobacter sp. TaxID=50741 RepID=UPI003298868B